SAWLWAMKSVTGPWPVEAAGFLSAWPVEAYRSRRAEIPDPPDVAMPTAMSRIARAATPAIASAMGSTVRSPSVLVREAEETRRQVDGHDLEILDELRPDPGRLQPALDLALDDTGLLEDEHVLHDDDVAFHALDLGDVDDLPGPVLEPALLDDPVDRRGDLLPDRPDRQGS